MGSVELIQQYLGIDLNNPATRQRAWRRIRVYRDIAEECEKEGSKETAAFLRRVYTRAISGEQDDHSLLNLAMLAGAENGDDEADAA